MLPYVRLIFFAITLAAILGATLIVTPAWIYSWQLTHPGCPASVSTNRDLPTPEVVSLHPQAGFSLRAWYYPARNGAAILALGGMSGALGDQLPPTAFLVQSGYGVLQIDTRACAQPPQPVTLGSAEILDAQAGVRFLLARPEVARVGVFGFSMGGATAIRAAARQPEIAAVVAEGGYFNLGKDFVETEAGAGLLRKAVLFTVAASYWLQTGANPWQVSPIDDLPAISPRPILLIYGEMETASGKAYEQLAAAREPKALWIVPGGEHGRNYERARADYERRVLEFFGRVLQK